MRSVFIESRQRGRYANGSSAQFTISVVRRDLRFTVRQ